MLHLPGHKGIKKQMCLSVKVKMENMMKVNTIIAYGHLR